MTLRRPDAPSPRRSPGSPFTIAAAVTLSACLLGSGALVAHADEGAAPAAAETTATAAVPASAAPTSATAGSTPSLSTAPQDVAPAPIAPAVAPAPAPAASTPVSAPEAPARTMPDAATTPIAAASTIEVPTAAAETPVAPAPVIQEAPAFEPAAATETPVSTPQQQPTPAAAATTDGVTATVRGALDLKPGEKPQVGTPVKWTITFHNSTPDAVFVLKTLVRLEPGESAQVDDNLPPATLTQADLDAGVVTYRSRYDIGTNGTNGTQRTVRAQGELTLPTTAPTPPPSQPTTPNTTPTTPPVPAVTSDGVTATAQGALDLKPGEKPQVGTPVKWTITFHNSTPDAVFVLKTLVRLEPGESAQVDDNLPPATLTQADLDAGVITYRSRYDIGANGSERILRVQGELTLPEAAPAAPHSDRVTASVRAVPDLEPGEQVKVGTVVKWIVTFHHSTPDTARIGGTTLVLTPGRSGYVEDTTKPSTVTQSDLDAGVVTYRSEFSVSTAEGSYTIPATGELTLPKPAPELPIGTTTGPATGTTPGTETGTTTDGTSTGTATAAGTTAPVGSGAATGGESVAAGTDSADHAAVGTAARSGAGVASAPAAANQASGSTSAKSSATKSASAAHLAQTGVDTAAALPAAGILGLLGALGLLLGARRRRNRTAD